MQIEVRSTERLRGEKPLDLAPVFGALAESLPGSALDLSRTRVVMDWVQYRQSFRNVVDVRRLLPGPLDRDQGESYEIAIDLRRAGSASLPEQMQRAFAAPPGKDTGRQYLEDWSTGTESCIWQFNGLYWNSLGLWEQSTGREYEQALPGGESDARNADAARDIILELFKVWDSLAARHALPEDLHILELGPGNGGQARVWLDEFRRLDRERGGNYYRRLHYLMGDYSPHVLERARLSVKDHLERCSTLVMDARNPTDTLAFLRSKAFLIYISNTYDNLPTDEIVRIGGHLFRVEVRAYIGPTQAQTIAADFGIDTAALPDLVLRLLALGPELLSKSAPERFPEGPLQATTFWRAAWDAVRLEERYVPIEGLDTYRVARNVGGEVLRPIVEANGDVRMHVSNGAVGSFLDSLPLLHPFGVLQCLDIFVTDMKQYATYRGPGKYDGSVVNWVNGPLLAAAARRNGYDASFQTFNRQGSNIITLTARVQE